MIIKIGNSLGITLPKMFLNLLNWKEGDKVEKIIDITKGRIIIERSKKNVK